MRWGYSQLRHRVPYTMFLFGFDLSSIEGDLGVDFSQYSSNSLPILSVVVGVGLTVSLGRSRDCWMIYRGPCFLAVVWFGSSPPPPPSPPLPSGSSTGDTQEDWERGVGVEGEWVGWGRSQIIRPQESVVLYKSFFFKILWPPLSRILSPPLFAQHGVRNKNM